MANSDEEGDLSPKEIARRRDETIRRMFATPPTPHKPKGDAKATKTKRQFSSPKGKRGS